jgi:hypothetical protein
MKNALYILLFFLSIELGASERIRVHYYYLEELGVSPSLAVCSTLPSPHHFLRENKNGEQLYTPIHFAIERSFDEMHKRIKNNRHNIPILDEIEIVDQVVIISFKENRIREYHTRIPIRLALKLTIGENLYLRKNPDFKIPDIKGFILKSADGRTYPQLGYMSMNPLYFSVTEPVATNESEQVRAGQSQ